jgi:trimeric autotransporter adhesin
MRSYRHVKYQLLAVALVALLALALCALPGPWGGSGEAQAAPSAVPNLDNWVTDGAVCSVASDGDTDYLGGFFSYVGPNTGYAVPFNTSSGSPAGTYPRMNNSVTVEVPDGSGGWYLGGYFTSIDGTAVNRLAHILADGTLDTAFDPDLNNGVRAMVRSGSILYVGGSFTSVQGSSGGPYARNYLAAIDTVTGNPTAWNPGPGNDVSALALSGSTLYIGGAFGNVQGASGGPYTRSYIAAIDTVTGNPYSWSPNASNPVSALAVSGSTVYAGGSFTGFSGASGGPYPRNYLAAIDTVTGNPTAWNPNADSTVVALAVYGSTVYAGGNFAHLQGASGGPYTRGCVAAIDAATGNPTAWNPGANGLVNSLALSGSTVYIGGGFTSVQGASGGPYTRNYFAAIDISTGNPTGMIANASGYVLGLALSGSTLYVGGNFFSIGGQRRIGLAALDAATGALTAWDPGLNNMIRSVVLSSDGSTLYVGGQFTSVQGASGGPYARNYLAAIDTTTGNPTAFNPGPDNYVWSLAISGDGSTLYAGGDFNNVQGASGGPYTRNFIAAIDIASSNPTTWRPNPGGVACTLVLSGTTLYIGGAFTSVQGSSGGPYARNYIAAIDTITGNPTTWNPNANSFVYSLAVFGTTVYAGGQFTTLQGSSGGPYTRNYLAAIDTATANPTAFNPGADYVVMSLALSGSSLYAGGSFLNIQGSSGGPYARAYLAAIDTATGNPTTWNPNVSSDVTAVYVSGSTLYAGGSFTAIGGRTCVGFAGFDGPPGVGSIAPASGVSGQTVSVTGLAGSDYRAGAEVLFRKTGEADIEADNVTVVSATRITCDFDLTGAAVGDWDVVVVNPDAQEGVLAGGFTVDEPVYSAWYLAEGCTGGDFETWVLVQNSGDAAVTVDLTLLTESGPQNPPALQGVEIPADSRTSFNIGEYAQTYNVSTVVTPQDGEVICERAMYGGERTWGTDSIGTTTPASTWYLAEGCTGGGFETWVLAMNPGASPVTVDLTFMTSAGPQAGPQDVSIPAYSRTSFNAGDWVTDYNVSTLVTSASGDVVCERAMYGNGRTWAHDSVGVIDPATTWYLAEGCTADDFETWVLVQNPNASAVTVDLILMTDTGMQKPAGLQDVTIGANSRRSFNLGDHVMTFDVSTLVKSSGGDVICERAMYGGERTWGTDSIGSTVTATTWYLAEGCTGGDFETWVLVMNSSADQVTVDLTFMTSAGPQSGPQDVTIPGQSRVSFNVGDYVTDYNVSTEVTCTGGGVVCERAMYGNGRTWAHDSVGYAP